MKSELMIRISRKWMLLFILFIVIYPIFITYILPLTRFWYLSRKLIILQDVVILLTALYGTLLGIQKKMLLKRWLIPALAGAFFFLFPQIFLFFQNHQDADALLTIIRFFLLFYIFLITSEKISFYKKDFVMIAMVFGFFFLFCCFYDIFQNYEAFRTISMDTFRDSIFQSVFLNPNRFACFLGLTIILSISAFWLSKKTFFLLNSLFLTFYLFLTGSRGSVIMVFLFVIGFILSLMKKNHYSRSIFMILDIFLLGLILWQFDFIRKFCELKNGLTGREYIWRLSWQLFRSSNIFAGNGLTNLLESIIEIKLNQLASAHNGYISVLYSGGILLASFYTYIFVVIFQRTTIIRRHFWVPFVLSVSFYGFFESTVLPFYYSPISNYFTVCLVALPLLVKEL